MTSPSLYSICLATYNGEIFIEMQLKSILSQLPMKSEIIISDNGSSDNTLSIIESLNDKRIIIISCQEKGVVKNFENALKHANGDIIFLSDQDDIWLPDKFDVFTKALEHNDIVVSDCIITNEKLEEIHNSFFSINKSSKGIFKNLLKNSYIGCNMAFNRKILNLALPIPSNTPMHDWWIGLIGEKFGNPLFIKDKTLLYRRHAKSFSLSGEKSAFTLYKKITFRIHITFNLLSRIIYGWTRNKD